MRLDRIRLAEGNVDVSAVSLPSGLAGSIVLVRIGDAAVMLFAELVFRGIGIGIAAQPELLDEGLALLVVAEISEGFPFFVGDDVGDVLIEPGFERAL